VPTRVKLLAVALLLLALPAYPQTTPTGSISGKAVDQQDLAVPGVTVTVASPALQGTRSTTTSANGDFIVPFLPPGEYAVTFELTGFATLKREERVSLNQNVPVNVTMSVTTVSETVTVVGQATGDFGQGSVLASNYKKELIDKLPLNRSLLSAVTLAPGTADSGPQGAVTISGGASFENLFLVNGVVIQDNIRSTPFNLFIEDALQETTVTAAAVSAEFGRFGGGVVNAITKSGGNELSGSFRTSFDNDDWTGLTPFPNDTRLDDVIPTYEATLGGPFVKDRLWFFGAARLRDEKLGRTTNAATAIPYTFGRDEKRYEGKLTWSLNPNHTFKGAYSHISSVESNSSFGSILDEASLYDRELPQDLLSLNYTGIINPRFFVEAQYSKRAFTFVGSGSRFTDLVQGTLLLDQSRGNARYNSPTFCGVCDDEKRDNQNVVAKASYFLSTTSSGSHNLVFGFDVFDDKRFSNNHQSGSDYRIFTTSAIVQGTQVFPVLDDRTVIRWTPIFVSSEGNRFRTISGFVNDAWTLNKNLTFNVGLRWDKNDGKDSQGNVVVKDSAISPRLAVTVDPKGDGEWTVNASYAQYVAAIANGVGDNGSAGGLPATIDFAYLGPVVNTGDPASPLGTDAALTTLFDWFNANGGTDRPTLGAPSIPGLTTRIDDRLKSPNVQEFALGFTRRLGSKASVRVDGIYRKFRDFYSQRVDTGTGTVIDDLGREFDLAIIENTNEVSRRYKALNAQFTYRPFTPLSLGGNYTLSRTYGTFNGETGPGGPSTAGLDLYPEYFDPAWGSGNNGTTVVFSGGGPEGDLLTDVRHRTRLWATWSLPVPSVLGSFDLGTLYQFNTGSPYGLVGLVDPRPYVDNPGYVVEPSTVEYYFGGRDALRMESTHRVDLSLNWARRVGVGNAEVFFRGFVLNVFDRDGLTNFVGGQVPGQAGGCSTGGCINTTILTNRNSPAIAAFDPFATTPVEGVHWRRGTQFGMPVSRFAYQTPRTYSFSVGFRF